MEDWGGSSVLFEDTFKAQSIDREGKRFQRVARIEGVSELYEVQLSLDVNSELHPVEAGEYHSVVLASTLNLDGTEDRGSYVLHENYTNTLMSKCDYCMYGKIYKFKEEGVGQISVHISFGGLLMSLVGQVADLKQLELDSHVYLLLKKL